LSLAFLLRLIALGTRPIWYDDAFEFFLSRKNFSVIISGAVADTMPPLHYGILHCWLVLVGETPFALRMSSVALSMLIVALVFAIATRGLGARVGIVAAFFTALAPFQIYHAQELRMYTTFALAVLLYVYAVMRLTTRARYARFLIALATALALYSHNLAFLTLGAANVYFLWRRDWNAQSKLIAAQIGGALLFLPWLFLVPTQIAKIQRAFWTQLPGFADVLQMLVVFTTHLPLPPFEFAIALFITLAIFVIAALELGRAFRRGAPPTLGFVLAFALVPPVLMFTLSYVMRPVFVPRGVIASSLAYYILLAYLVARAPRTLQIALSALAALIAVMALPFFYSAWGEWRRAPFAEANQFLRAHAQSSDLIVHDNKLSFFPMHFYDRALPQEFLADPSDSSNDTLARGSQEALGLFPVELDVALSGRARVWFIIFQTAIDEAAQEGHAHGNLSQLDAAMRRGDVAAFGDLRIYRYEVR
ncbi:MAG: glycosyltransferase family 39 protein, partial [Anaerolineales bacterium]|nr:glycosyltransferase family 39 protein [Anaerolineales bacterium]